MTHQTHTSSKTALRSSAMGRVALAAVTAGALLVSTGCATLGGMAPAARAPGLGMTETELLYSRALRNNVEGAVKKLGLSPSEKVAVINKIGGTNNDSTVDALTYDALVDVIRNKNLGQVVERDEDLLRDLYVEHTESAQLSLRDSALGQETLGNPDVIIAYRLVRAEAKIPGIFPAIGRSIVSAFTFCVADGTPNMTDGLRIALHLDLIDAKSGQVRQTAIFEHTEPQNDWIRADVHYGAK